MGALFFFCFGLILAVGVMLLRRRYAAFQAQTAADYEDEFPLFEMKSNFAGQMICEGVIFGPFGRVTSTFIADFDILWDGDSCEIRESFVYNDGSRQIRVWTIKMKADGGFIATAPDVPGQATGVSSGPAVQVRYRIRLPDELGAHVLDTVDWLYLTPNGTIVNRSQFRKFGFKVAELVATIRPKETA